MTSVLDKKPKSKRTRLDPEKRRQLLLDVAVTVTAKSGLGRARHADIAKLAGVAVSTVFFYFPTVDHLSKAVIDEVENVFTSIPSTISIDITSKESFSATLKKHEQYFDHIVKQNVDSASIFLEWSNAVTNPLWPVFLKFRSKYLELIRKSLMQAKLQGELKDNLDIDAITIMISMLLMLVFKMKYFGDTDTAVKEVFQCISNHIFK